MNKYFSNSFYEQNLIDLKVLVLVPHEDDEINIAGNTITNLIQCGADVKVCFSTNGDYILPASTRISEAVKSLESLGCSKHNIYFLGYGDSLNDNPNGHIFYSLNSIVKSSSGHTETYAASGFEDYAYSKTGKHSQYNASSYYQDLENIILDILPNIIICVDLDTHADHRMLSLALDKVMSKILREQDNYKPLILKRFAYDLAYFAEDDFYNINLQANKKPIAGKERCCQQIVDKAYYLWKDRVRLPIIQNEYGRFVFNKTIVKALLCHKSQSAAFKALGIINSDEVFFERRTDSISYKARVEVSSGNGKYLNDFRILNLTDIDSTQMQFADYLWQPDANDTKKSFTFSWKQPQIISFIRLYGSFENTGSINKIRISFDNGYSVEKISSLGNGRYLDISIPIQKNIKSLTIQVLEAEGTGYGISECEIYSDAVIAQSVFSFVKLTVNDNFAYKYIVDKSCKSIMFDIYKYNCYQKVNLSIVSGDAEIIGQKLFFHNDNSIVLRAESADGRLYDQILVERKHRLVIYAIQLAQKIEKFLFILYCRCWRKYEYLKNKRG